jgi:8-oxo-dGTP diphosphatase
VTMSAGVIRKVGLLVVREASILLCRKKHTTSLLILPGGKPEPGESALDCLRREVAEELGPAVQVSSLRYLGTYSDIAAGSSPGQPRTVEIALYQGELHGTPEARSEVAEVVWFGSSSDRTQLAPSLANKIVPDLVSRGILSWNS